MDATTARRLWVESEPLHSMVYSTPEPRARYEALGLEGATGYFASRSAAMGQVTGGVVAAAVYGFNPVMVCDHIAAAWQLTDPCEVVAARLEGATAALRPIVDAVVADGALRYPNPAGLPPCDTVA